MPEIKNVVVSIVSDENRDDLIGFMVGHATYYIEKHRIVDIASGNYDKFESLIANMIIYLVGNSVDLNSPSAVKTAIESTTFKVLV